MISIGRIALLIWALALAYVGYLLVVGQTGVAMTALENGRLGDAITQFVFITIVIAATVVSCALFIFVGVLRE